MKSLEGKIAIVTGAGRGIGAATAEHLAELGARVALVARTRSEIDAVAAGIASAQGPDAVLAIQADISSEKAVRSLFDQVASHWGACEILVNNAAVYVAGEIADLDSDSWNKSLQVNVNGSFFCAREAMRQMKSSGLGGSIINLSSLGGVPGTEKFKGSGAYVVSKYAVTGLTEILAVEGKPHGVRVNCIAPGAVETRMLKEAAPFLKTQTRPADVAKLIGFLSDSGRSGAITGAVLPIYSNA